MTEAQKRLNEVLTQIVEEKTFSLEAVEAIKELRREFELLQSEEKDMRKALHDVTINSEERINFLQDEVNKQKNIIDGWVKQAVDLTNRENNMTRIEGQRDCERAVAGAYENAMRIVFKNPVMQKQVLTSEPQYDEFGNERFGNEKTKTLTETDSVVEGD